MYSLTSIINLTTKTLIESRTSVLQESESYCTLQTQHIQSISLKLLSFIFVLIVLFQCKTLESTLTFLNQEQPSNHL